MSIFAMQLANAFSARELSVRQSLLKNSIHKLSSGTKLVKAQDDSGMLSVRMKMDAAKYKNASSMNKLASGVSYTDMQDGILNNTQSILTRMSELKGLSINDPLKSEQDIDAYNNEFRDLQRQLFQLSKTTFNGTSLFATTVQIDGGSEVRFRGSDLEVNNIAIKGSFSVINLQKLPLLAALTLKENNSMPDIINNFPGTGFDFNGNEIGVGQIDNNWSLSGPHNVARRMVPVGGYAAETAEGKWLGFDWADGIPGNYLYSTTFDLSGFDMNQVSINGNFASDNEASIHINGIEVIPQSNFPSPSYSTLSSFSISSSTLRSILSPGKNQFQINVFNEGTTNNPTGILLDEFKISAVENGNFDIFTLYSDRLKTDQKCISLAIENEVSLSNLGDVQMSYFNQAIENISYLRAQVSATQSRLKFTYDLEYENKSLTTKAYGRIADVDYASESTHLAKQKIMTSASATMIAQANTMGDVVLAMLN